MQAGGMANNPSCADSIEAGSDIGKLSAHRAGVGQVRLSSHSGAAAQLQTMPASEQMFFLGAPFAHVVRYEEELRATRHEKNLQRLARLRTASRRHV
jgi:hypothetical protein